MKKQKLFLVVIAIIISNSLAAQVAINTDGSSGDASAMLDIKSTTSGLLPPRMTEAQRTEITSPATGLLVYQTNLRDGYYYNSGTPASPSWVNVIYPIYTADMVLTTNADGYITTSSVTDSELGYLSGVTGNVQGQINGLSSNASRQNAVKDIINNNTVSPPTENAGDRYILSSDGGSPHADWDWPSPGDIVEFDGSSWQSTTPQEGMVVYNDDSNTDFLYIDDGTPEWEQRSILSTALSQGQIFIGDWSGEAAAQTLSGDLTIDVTGETTIGSAVVTNDMLAGSITNDKLAGSISSDKLAISQGKIYIGNPSGAAAEQTISGDVSLSEAGVTAIGSAKVTNDMLAGSITNDKLAGSITNDKLTNGDYMISSAGTSAQVWTSDGSGAGAWSTPSGSSQWTTSGSDIYFNLGKVGIGTTSPSESLHIYTADNQGMYLQGTGAGIWFDIKSSSSNQYSIGALTSFFSIYDRTETAYRMVIDNTGNVGIGTTSPSSELEVDGSITLSSWDQNINFGSSGGFSIGRTSGNILALRTNSTERLVIDNSGNIGIGTSPSYTLHVNGSVAGTSAYNNLSDARLKKDVLAIEHSLDKVMALRPVTFNWNKTVNTDLILDDRNHIGFIAQEVEEVFPQVISTADDEMKTKSIAYSDLVPVLTKAIQEQQAQIEALKAQNETLMLKAEAFEQLKADVEILKKAISSDIVQRISND